MVRPCRWLSLAGVTVASWTLDGLGVASWGALGEQGPCVYLGGAPLRPLSSWESV